MTGQPAHRRTQDTRVTARDDDAACPLPFINQFRSSHGSVRSPARRLMATGSEYRIDLSTISRDASAAWTARIPAGGWIILTTVSCETPGHCALSISVMRVSASHEESLRTPVAASAICGSVST